MQRVAQHSEGIASPGFHGYPKNAVVDVHVTGEHVGGRSTSVGPNGGAFGQIVPTWRTTPPLPVALASAPSTRNNCHESMR